MWSLVWSLVCFLQLLGVVVSHPQCLDYTPPHRPTSSTVRFCDEYSQYTCCTAAADQQLKHTYHQLRWKNKRRWRIPSRCYTTLKEIMCLKCHPYAAHVFDAEVPDRSKVYQKSNVNFPGLCQSYCKREYQSCKVLIQQLFTDNRFRRFALTSPPSTFCKWAETSDKAYCYPAVKNINKDIKVTNDGRGIEMCVEENKNRFANALLAVHANDGSHRLFIGEQRGRIYILDDKGVKKKKPFLDISDKIINSGQAWDERGLLGMAFHPQYKTNGHFYVYYSAPNRNIRRGRMSNYQWYWKTRHTIKVSEFVVSSRDPNKADPSSEMTILQVDQPDANHNGGMIFFGSHDGYLYVSLGDGGGAGDPWKTGMNLNTLLGKILRIDVNDRYKRYGIPHDNPFVGRRNARPEIFAYGARNMWRCSQDNSHRIFCGDVGQGRFEEINIIQKGMNYGWSAYEGYSCYNRTLCSKPLPDLQFPIIAYSHKVGQSVVGGHTYRGCDNPNLSGKYVYGDTMNGRLFVAQEYRDTGEWEVNDLLMGGKRICNQKLTGLYNKNILSFGEDEAGELFFLASRWPSPTFESTVLYRLVDPALRGDPDECKLRSVVRKARPLGRVRRRYVYTQERNKVAITPSPPRCRDEMPDLCQHYFGKRRNGRRPRQKCRSYQSYTSKYCKLTCNFC